MEACPAYTCSRTEITDCIEHIRLFLDLSKRAAVIVSILLFDLDFVLGHVQALFRTEQIIGPLVFNLLATLLISNVFSFSEEEPLRVELDDPFACLHNRAHLHATDLRMLVITGFWMDDVHTAVLAVYGLFLYLVDSTRHLNRLATLK